MLAVCCQSTSMVHNAALPVVALASNHRAVTGELCACTCCIENQQQSVTRAADAILVKVQCHRQSSNISMCATGVQSRRILVRRALKRARSSLPCPCTQCVRRRARYEVLWEKNRLRDCLQPELSLPRCGVNRLSKPPN